MHQRERERERIERGEGDCTAIALDGVRPGLPLAARAPLVRSLVRQSFFRPTATTLAHHLCPLAGAPALLARSLARRQTRIPLHTLASPITAWTDTVGTLVGSRTAVTGASAVGEDHLRTRPNRVRRAEQWGGAEGAGGARRGLQRPEEQAALRCRSWLRTAVRDGDHTWRMYSCYLGWMHETTRSEDPNWFALCDAVDHWAITEESGSVRRHSYAFVRVSPRVSCCCFSVRSPLPIH